MTDSVSISDAGKAAQLADAIKETQDAAVDSDPGPYLIRSMLEFMTGRKIRIFDASELFGPTTDEGFAELAKLDDDKNGWIDENDAAFNQLQLWSRDSNGHVQRQSLLAADIGAIAPSRIITSFELKTNENEILGKIRTSGIFLHEDGEAGTIQQIDLTA